MRNFLVWVSYFFLALLLFFKGHQGMLVTDVNGWLNTYQRMGWHGLPNSFGDKSLHHLYHLAFFVCYKFFGFHNSYWAVCYIALHSLAATMAFIFFRKVYEALQISLAPATAYAGGLLFLLSAYNAETVLWAACIHYPLCIIFCLAALTCMVDYAMHGKAISAALFIAFFIISLFLLELALALPLICIPLVFVFRQSNFSRQNFISLQAVSVFLVFLYLAINKLKFGSVVGHYGAATHLNTDPVLLAGNLDKYFAKYFAFSQFWKFDTMSKLYALFEKPVFAYSSIAFFAMLVLLFVLFRRRLSVRIQAALVFLGCAVMALAPVLNLYFTSIVHNECDRLGYFFAVFFSQALAVFSFSFLPPGVCLVLAYLGLNIYFLNKNVSDWKTAGAIEQNLVSTYKWQNTPQVFILDLPDNFEGAYMYRSFDSASEFKDALKVRGVSAGNIAEVLKYNMRLSTDSVTVEKLSDDELKVTFGQWGNWWWSGGKGAEGFSTAAYHVKIDEWSHSYVIHFKAKKSGAVYLYQSGKDWREINF